MGVDPVAAKLGGFVAQELLEGDGEDLTVDTPLLELGVVDSLAIAQLMSFVEETFGVTVPRSELNPKNFASVGAMAALVARLQQARSQQSCMNDRA